MLKYRLIAAGLGLAAMRLCAFQLPDLEPFEAPEPPSPPVMFALRAGGVTNQSFLGVGVAEINSNRAQELKLKEEYGVEITRIEDESAAAKAGLKVGDVVLAYNGQRVEGIEQFMRLVHETPTGREIKLLISRGGASQTLPVVMGSQKNKLLLGRAGEWFDMPQIPDIKLDLPALPRAFSVWSSSMLGIEAESLTPQLGEFFGVKEGVLVRSVVKDSAAEKAGIKAGDVVVKVDQTSVSSPGEVTSAVRAAHLKKTFPIELIRERHPTTVTVTVEGDHSDQELPRTRVLPGRTVKM